MVACGLNDEDQCNIPDLPEGETYIQVSAGHSHTVLLKSDGHVVACGDTAYGKCNIPNLPKGATYTQASAAYLHTVLLRSDGDVVAFGDNYRGQCNIPSLRTWVETLTFSCTALKYVTSGVSARPEAVRVIQLSFSLNGSGRIEIMCSSLTGETLCTVALHERDPAIAVAGKIAEELAASCTSLKNVLPDGRLLESMAAATSVSELMNAM